MPNRSDQATTVAPAGVASVGTDPATISRVFSWVALAEATTWTGLLIGMIVKYAGGSDAGVAVFGPIHGVVVLVYVAVAVIAARQLAWGARTLINALLASVPPLGTLWFERWARRTGRLAPRYRARGD